MNRESVLSWFRHHRDALRCDPEEVVTRCERAVRRHAREDAWLAAKAYANHARHEWESRPGAHASEAYVANELCHQIAHALREHEPDLHEADGEHLAGGPVKGAVDPDSWDFLVPWILELANDEKHKTWEQIARYTDRHARELITEHHLSSDCSFDHTKRYGEIAEKVTAFLERDFSVHAFPR